jgi:hypothetical protein
MLRSSIHPWSTLFSSRPFCWSCNRVCARWGGTALSAWVFQGSWHSSVWTLLQNGMQNYTKLEQCLLTTEVPEICRLYPEIDAELPQVQLPMFKQSFEYASSDEVATAMRTSAPEVRRLFGQVEVLLRSLLVVLGMSCEADRSFSALHCWRRGDLFYTMSQTRLNSTAVCHVHQKYIDKYIWRNR